MKRTLAAIVGVALAGTAVAAQGGRGSASLPTEAQWAAMSPKAKEYVDKAKALAGDDPDLQFDFGIKLKVESVMQGHPNTNMNLLARTKYVHDNYPPARNPLLYGAQRTARYIGIMRHCTLARMEILGW